MDHVRVERKTFKRDRQCYMCGMRIKRVIVILSPLHGFILCDECTLDLKDALDEIDLSQEF
jgi:hypothetical protein